MTDELGDMSTEERKRNISNRLVSEGLRSILTERYNQNIKAYVEDMLDYDNDDEIISMMVIDICNDLFGPVDLL